MSQKGVFVILRRFPFSESDLIVHALSDDGAKVSFIARGALKSKKRFAGGVLEPTHHVELVYRAPKAEDGLAIIEEARLLNDFPKKSRHYDAISLALHSVDCVSRVSFEGDVGNQALYRLLGNMLKAIEIREDLEILKTQFHLKLLWQQGVLTIEPWMKPYLARPLLESMPLIPDDENLHRQSEYADAQVREYLLSASL